MPTRLLREGILTSERIEELDPQGEVFYRRLMSKVDDHGLYDARPSILRASLYPLRVDKVRESDIHRWIAACEKARLIALYAHEGRASSSRWITAADLASGVKAGLAVSEKPYLKMLDTRWQVRAEAKFPLPPDSTCKQLQTPVYLDAVEVVVEDEDVGGTSAPSANAHDAASPPVIAIPIVGGNEFQVTEAMVQEFEPLYPAVDVPQTLREIRAWCLTNPARRKTKAGVMRFVNSWLSREQNKG
jgi:hypothetical protein